jgi:hypothetical protein
MFGVYEPIPAWKVILAIWLITQGFKPLPRRRVLKNSTERAAERGIESY